MYEYFQNKPIETTTSGEVSKHLLQILNPDDFSHEVIKLNSLYTFLLTANPAGSVLATTDDEKIAKKKRFKKRLTIMLGKESMLYVEGKSVEHDKLVNSLAKFITP